MSIYDRIDHLRKKQGITLTYLNELINGYRGKLTEVKNGKSTLTNQELEIIASALHTTPDYLLGNTDDPMPVGWQKERSPIDGEREISDDDIKFALFGGDGEITDAMYDEVKRFAQMVKLREEAEKKKE